MIFEKITENMKVTTMERAMLRRTELLIGEEAIDAIFSKRVIIFGVGGVGSWCAESLVRSGIRHLTIVDSDRVCVTNCNRQLMATSKTIGQVKVETLKERLLEINPNADIIALQKIYQEEDADSFHIETYDYVIDAIDSLKDKAHLILHTTELSKKIRQGHLKGEGIARKLTLVSSMGAALRVDPTKIRVAEFWKVRNDTLGKALRKRFKHRREMPSVKFRCVYSEELPLENKGVNQSCGTSQCMCPKAKLLSGVRGTDTAVYDAPGDQSLVEHEWCTSKAQINGTMSHITAIFGFTIAGLVMEDILNVNAE